MARILVVDDGRVSPDKIETTLERQGHEVIRTDNIRDICRRLKEQPVDFAILNARAVRVARVVFTYLRCARPGLPVIVPSSLAARENDRFAGSSGAFIIDSEDPEILLRRVQEIT